MKKFRALVIKEFKHIIRDRRTLLIVLFMPIVQILLFGFAINMETNNINTVFYAPNRDKSIFQLEEKFSTNPYFNFKGYVDNITEVEKLMKKGKIDMAIIFEPMFNQHLNQNVNSQVQIVTNTSDPNRGTIATNYATNILKLYQVEISESFETPYFIDSEIHMIYNPELKSSYTFVPGIIGLVLTLICAIMTSVSIVKEKEMGTMDVLLSSPLNSSTMLTAKMVPYIGVSIVNLITILLLSVFILKVPINGSIWLLSLGSLMFILMSLTLGLLISSVVSKQADAIMISGIGLLMPTIVLSGMIFPIENMPSFLQWVSTTVPARWFIAFVKKVMIEGLGIEYVIKELIIMTGMMLLFISASIFNVKSHIK